MRIFFNYVNHSFVLAFFCLYCAQIFAENASTYFSRDSAFQSSSQTSTFQLSTLQQIQTLQLFYEKQQTDIEAVKAIFDDHWLAPDASFEPARIALEQQYLQTQERLIAAPDDERLIQKKQLLELKLRWIYFSPAHRSNLIANVQAKKLANISQKALLTADEISNNTAQNIAQLRAKTQNIHRAVSEREKSLLNMLTHIENQFSQLLQQTQLMNDAQEKLNIQSQNWNQFSNDINNALDDEQFLLQTSEFTNNQQFNNFRSSLLADLIRSNQLVKAESAFINFYFKDGYSNHLDLTMHNIQVRENDSEVIKNLINTIYQKQLELQTKVELLRSTRKHFMAQLVQWNFSYRRALLEQRGKLIQKLLQEPSLFFNNFSPVIIELKTIYASARFYLWQKKYSNGNSKRGYSWLIDTVFYALKLLLIFAAITWLLLKRKYIINKISHSLIKRTQRANRKKYILPALEVLRYLYVFIVLFVLGYSVVEFLVAIGINAADYLKPILTTLIIFFLFLGLINLFVSWVSNISHGSGDTQGYGALEIVLAFIPKLVLYYWLASQIVNIVLFEFLYQSLAHYYFDVLCTSFFIGVLFITVWWQRKNWRMINEQAMQSVLWRSITEKSQGKPWEPVILLVGGGVGVYRIIWRQIAKRLIDLELTRRFQAMVSRALLERQISKNAVKLDPAWFPENYWRAFSFLVPAAPDYYIPRAEPTLELEQAFIAWQQNKAPARILICGDRGIGKSELISHFIRDKNVDYKKCALKIGESTTASVYERIGVTLLGQKGLDEQAIVDALQTLPPHILVLENLENSLLRQNDGFDAFAAIIDLMLQCSVRHLWLTTCTSHAWIIAKQALIGLNNFTHIVSLKGLSEDQIKAMLLYRHNKNSLIVPDFSPLNLKEEKPSKHFLHLAHNNEDKGQEMYFRILWDYTRGNPRQALYYWKASLSWDGDKTLVKLFEVPDQKVLEQLPDSTLMLLAALIEHNGLDIKSLSSVMNSSVANIRRRIEELTPYGMVFSLENEASLGWHVESFWARAVEIYLEKRQFLFKGQ